MGKVVRVMLNEEQSAGFKVLQWNGSNTNGQPVSSGLYIYTITTDNFSKTRKMILMK